MDGYGFAATGVVGHDGFVACGVGGLQQVAEGVVGVGGVAIVGIGDLDQLTQGVAGLDGVVVQRIGNRGGEAVVGHHGDAEVGRDLFGHAAEFVVIKYGVVNRRACEIGARFSVDATFAVINGIDVGINDTDPIDPLLEV